MVAGPSLSIATYNVHGCVGTDGVHHPARVARVIASLGASIVGLQEIDSRPEDGAPISDLDIVASGVGLQAVPGAVRSRASGPYGNALLSAWPVRAVRRIDLCVAGREPRGALDVDVDVEGQLLRVVVTHFGLAPHERRWQTRQLLKILAAEPQDAAVTVLLGDLNEWLALGRPLRWLHRNFGRSPSLATFPSRLPLLALDRVWTQPRQSLVGMKRIWSRQTRVASDHVPLVAQIQMPPGPATKRFPASTDPTSLGTRSTSAGRE